MLVLSRRLAETLRIGEEIEVTILSISGNQVRLGIVAPPDVAVDREEIYKLKKEAVGAELPMEEGGLALRSDRWGAAIIRIDCAHGGLVRDLDKFARVLMGM